MRSGRELVVVPVATAVALAVTSGAAVLALREATPMSTSGPTARLPAVLFVPEAPAPVAPVRPEIVSELTEDPVVAPESPLPVRTAQAAPAVAAPTSSAARILVSLNAPVSRTGDRTRVTYIATVANLGAVAVEELVLTAHVPSSSVWLAAAPCRGSRAVTLSYGTGSASTVCIPGDGGTASNDHPFALVLDRPLAPGSVATATYTVDVLTRPGGTVRLVNHLHADGAGIGGSSPELVTEVAP